MFARPYLEKTHCKNMAGGVAQKKTIGWDCELWSLRENIAFLYYNITHTLLT
jgi:hypothetical protein